MSRRLFTPLSWLTIDYSPHPAERSFLERAHTLREREVKTTVAAHGRSVLYRRPLRAVAVLPPTRTAPSLLSWSFAATSK
jgi:hypothetical protein